MVVNSLDWVRCAYIPKFLTDLIFSSSENIIIYWLMPERFPTDFINNSSTVTPGSWNLFFALGLKNMDLPWFQCHSEGWVLFDSYREFEQIGSNMVCTNDVAERAIKLLRLDNIQ